MCRNGRGICLQLVEKPLKGVGTVRAIIVVALGRNLVNSLKKVLA